MSSPHIIRALLISLLLYLAHPILARQDGTDRADSPYRSEHNPWFKFGVFQRGYPNDRLTPRLDSLEAKPRKNWSRKDSLDFAELSKKTGNLELAAYYFDNLRVDYASEQNYWWERLVLHFLMREYNTCQTVITNAEPGLVEYSKLWFFKKICAAKLSSLADEKWFKKNSVLAWEVDSSTLLLDKDSPEFREKVITPLENLTFVLELLVRHIHNEDEVLARTFFEMGKIVRAYISPTQAFIAYSIGRSYDNWDKEIVAEIKHVKAEIIQKKFRIPIYRKNFPRIEAWRFDYELLKEKIVYQRSDTLAKTAPVLHVENDKPSVSFNPTLVLLAGIGIIFLCLLLFLKSGKKT